MITEFMHKHRRLIMVFVFLFVGLPLAFMVPGLGGNRGGSGSQFDPSYAVAMVGSTPITAEQFLVRYNDATRQRSQNGLPVSASDMVNDGTVEQIIELLIRETMIANQTQEEPVYPENDYLIERLQEDPYFRTDAGEFNKGLYNQWVKAQIKRGVNWDSIYDGVAADVNQEVYLALLGASGRAFESEIREEFEASRTKLRINFVAIQPTVELSEEELREHFRENLLQYMTPEERRADFLAISMKPDRPAIVDELLKRARAGEDFAELAKEYSESFDRDQGGDMGWIKANALLPEHQEALLALGAGEVSEPVESVAGIHLYKVEEERTNDEGERELHARQITIRPQLSEEEIDVRLDRAQELFTLAVETDGVLEIVAADEGLEMQSTGLFSNVSAVIDNVSNTDAFAFRQKMRSLDVGEVSGVIEGRDNLYVGVVTEILQPIQRTFEDAREDVERNAINLYKNGPEYIGKVAEYTNIIRESAETLDDIAELVPDLEFEVNETEAFGLNDFLFTQGLPIDTRQVFQALRGKEAGDLVGPLLDFMRVTHFIELVERIPPDESTWETEWEVESKSMRGAIQQMRKLARQSDHIQFLIEKASDEAMIQKDYDAIFSLLGLDETSDDVAASPPAVQPIEAPDASDIADDASEEETVSGEAIVLDLDEEQ